MSGQMRGSVTVENAGVAGDTSSDMWRGFPG